MENLSIRMLAASIELNWWYIRKLREKGMKLLEEGYSYSSEEMLKLNDRYSKHCASAMKAQQEYERRAGIKINAQITEA